MLQKEDLTFSQVERRKRLERTAQVGILGLGFSGVVWVLVRFVCAALAVAAKIATPAV
jgi:hypothetical protein